MYANEIEESTVRSGCPVVGPSRPSPCPGLREFLRTAGFDDEIEIGVALSLTRVRFTYRTAERASQSLNQQLSMAMQFSRYIVRSYYRSQINIVIECAVHASLVCNRRAWMRDPHAHLLPKSTRTVPADVRCPMTRVHDTRMRNSCMA